MAMGSCSYFEDSRIKKKKLSGRRRSSGFVVVSIWIICFYCFVAFAFVVMTTSLLDDEVEALHEIAESLGKKDWNFSLDLCSGDSEWVTVNRWKERRMPSLTIAPFPIPLFVTLLSLPGVQPRNLGKLPYLQEIDLSRNYLNGTIPAEWASLPFVNILLIGNRLSDPIPKEIGSIATLRNLTLEDNQLSGPLPPELGSLVDIDRIAIQASGLEGPIPSEISLLVKLTDMRITDINETEMDFPPLRNMTSMKSLILGSCNIIGPLPEYFGEMKMAYKVEREVPTTFFGDHCKHLYPLIVNKKDPKSRCRRT
ncbi:hypothetical protein NE237_032777 [Protea cynaroides]|uniref:Uncharacterized protein n=1 Tax=Protea cynaroides TaxID=273540 RepID=A0A9Q0R3F0_9MAGN|nr:hypothetical protein NE237_032777 [Protea cynaroides]